MSSIKLRFNFEAVLKKRSCSTQLPCTLFRRCWTLIFTGFLTE